MPRRAETDAADLFLDASADSHASSIDQRSRTGGHPAMTEISRATLFGKLNPVGYRAIEGATVFCKLRGNPYVELVHWLHQILNAQDSDLHRLVKHYEIDPSRLAADITAALDKLPRGATAISDFAPQIEEAVERAWVFGTLMFGVSQIRTGHLLLGMLKTPTLRNALFATSRQWEKIKPDALSDDFDKVLGSSPEAAMAAADGSRGAPRRGQRRHRSRRRWASRRRCRNSRSTSPQRARDGEIDPVTGRDAEIRQVVDVLMRRRQNNPILTGEAGVGKTAVVEGFALRIAAGDVPPQLKDVTLRTLDVGLLQAGASMKGEFEQRLRQVIEEVQSSPKPIILFIDEAHTLIGAGGAAGTGDAANLLKPALARGTLRTDRRHHLRRIQEILREGPGADPPLPGRPGRRARRGQGDPDDARHRLAAREAPQGASSSTRRSRPRSGSRTATSRPASCRTSRSACSTPPRPASPSASTRPRPRSRTPGAASPRWRPSARSSAARARSASTSATARPRSSSQPRRGARDAGRARGALGEGARPGRADPRHCAPSCARPACRSTLQPTGDAPDGAARPRGACSTSCARLQAELAEHQGENPLILPSVDQQAVASVVGDWTGIPVGRMVRNEAAAVLNLADTLAQRVVGQDHGLQMIARRVQTSRAGLDNPVQAGRRVHALRPLRRRQDRDRADHRRSRSTAASRT